MRAPFIVSYGSRAALVLATLSGVPSVGVAQPPQGPQAPPSIQGAEIKGRAPVSNDVLQVTLPRATEADLANGLHLIVLEDRRVPVVSMQIQIEGAGGYYDPADGLGLAGATAAMLREGTSTRSAREIAEALETVASS